MLSQVSTARPRTNSQSNTTDYRRGSASDSRVGSMGWAICASLARTIAMQAPRLTFAFSRGKVTASHCRLAQLFDVYAALLEPALPLPIALIQRRRLVASVCMLGRGPHTHGGPAQRMR